MTAFIKRVNAEQYESIELGDNELNYVIGKISSVSIVFKNFNEEQIKEVVDKFIKYNTLSIDFYFILKTKEKTRKIGPFLFNNTLMAYTKEEQALQLFSQEE